MDLWQHGAHVVACDGDPVVTSHTASDVLVLIEPGESPFAAESFDLIVSDVNLRAYRGSSSRFLGIAASAPGLAVISAHDA